MWARDAAARVAEAIEGARSLVLTGGTTAERLYPELRALAPRLGGVEVFFSDERCVAPDDPASNYGMTRRLLLRDGAEHSVHRMQGELDPETAATLYHDEVAAAAPLDVVLVGMGADCHVCALYPGSRALAVEDSYCVPVQRPDGLTGLTLTPPVLRSARRILVLVTGSSKAAAVRRVIEGNEPPDLAPARLVADHAGVTFLLDHEAATQLADHQSR